MFDERKIKNKKEEKIQINTLIIYRISTMERIVGRLLAVKQWHEDCKKEERKVGKVGRREKERREKSFGVNVRL